MNILTFDIEEWAIETAQMGGPRPGRLQEYDTLLSGILDLVERERERERVRRFRSGLLSSAQERWQNSFRQWYKK